ncbi:MAG TPA: hypothetical protein VLI54_00310 [Bacillota bacterium]|nr:hypothetical protein [Bacillota bacterium]
MSTQSEFLGQLLDASHAGHVFGEGVAFGELEASRRAAIGALTTDIMTGVTERMHPVFRKALPEMTSDDVDDKLQQMIVKAGVFMPALTVGELIDDDDRELLTLATQSLCCMYGLDELTDRGDIKARLAIERFTGVTKPFAGEVRQAAPADARGVTARVGILKHMAACINKFAFTGDAPDVLECYDQRVLRNEARLQRLSDSYYDFPEIGRQAFLSQHAEHIADLMVADAGFQSVTASLHTIYRHKDIILPSIAELHSHSAIVRLLEVCNAVARVADERGDWWMDAGNDKRFGVFSINPFNEYHPAMVGRLCELAGIVDEAEVAALCGHFEAFSKADPADQTTRDYHGNEVTSHFFQRMRDEVASLKDSLPGETYQRFSKYITLCMRVGEISFVNMMGDIHMSGAATA